MRNAINFSLLAVFQVLIEVSVLQGWWWQTDIEKMQDRVRGIKKSMYMYMYNVHVP